MTRLLASIAFVSSVGCSDARSAPDNVATLEYMRSVQLGTDTSASPAEVTLSALSEQRIAIADKTKRTVFGYAHDGTLAWVIGGNEDPDALPARPNAMSWSGDTLLIADVDARRGVWAFGRDGHFLEKVLLPFEQPVTFVSRTGNALVVATTSSDSLMHLDEALLVHTFDKDGRLLASGCPADSVYVASVKRGGLISIFRAMTAVASEEGIYCTQPLSPKLRLLTTKLQSKDDVSLEPFTRPPPQDVRGSMDMLSITEFRKNVTEVQNTFLSPRYSHSLVAWYDAASGGDSYLIVRCARETPHSCSAARSGLRIIGTFGDDSLVALEPRKTLASPLTIAILRYPRS